MHYWLVMPAAGAGRRFGAALPKQYASLAGRTVIEWALAPFLDDPRCAACVIAIAADDPWWSEVAVRLSGRRAAVWVAPGGAERCDSVRNGLGRLEAVAADEDWVLVHDAARPCLETADLDALLETLATDPTGGLLATPCADTLKRAESGGAQAAGRAVQATVPRESIWRALTPQMFRFGTLCRALDAARAAGRRPTDEAQALEWMGARPRLVSGSASNLKITTAEDLEIAQLLLARRPGKESVR